MTKRPPKILTKPKVVNYKRTRKPKGSSGHSLSAVLQFVRR